MATVSDVSDALVNLIVAALYPSSPSTSVVGYPVKVYAGWPAPQQLDIDMVESPPKSGKPTAAHVAVFPQPAERNTTRYPNERTEQPTPAKTYTLAVAGQVVTVGGAAPATYSPQNLAVFINGKPYVTQATAGQTPASLAAALRTLIVADVPGTTVSGANITLPAGPRIGALRVGVVGSTTREVRRQEKQFQVGVWTSNPASREAIDSTFDPILADTPRLTLADGTVAWLSYRGSRDDDLNQNRKIYRRVRLYCVEFATIRGESAPQVVVGEVDTSATDGTPIVTTYS